MKLSLAVGTTMMAASLFAAGAIAQSTRLTPRPRTTATVRSGSTYLGIGVQDIDAERAKALKLREVRGVEVTNVEPESPAAKAGVKDGDVVLEYNGQPVEGQEQLSRLVRETPAGREVKIGVWRNGAMQTVTATVEARRGMVLESPNGHMIIMPEMPRMPQMPEMPRMPQMEIPNFSLTWQNPMLGITGEALGQEKQLADFFGVKQGVLVKSVARNSAAEKAGIKAGDVIVKVDDTAVASTREITSALRAARSKKTITVVVIRDKKEIPLTVTIESASAEAPVRALLKLLSDDCVI